MEPINLSTLGRVVRRFWSEKIHGPLPRELVLHIPDGIDGLGHLTIPYLNGNGNSNGDGHSNGFSAQEETVKAERKPTELPDCLTDILLTLREHHPRPLTKTRLLEEMFTAGRTYADSTVARYLAVLMEDGTIENPGVKARPPGYRLTDPPAPS